MWCSFNLNGVDEPGFGPAAVKALEDCHRLGALGVGEVTDKGRGIGAMGASPGDAMLASNARASGAVPRGATKGPHADDPRMDALWNKCGQLGMLINMHVSDPIWAYQPMDVTNDGLMLGWTWRINVTPDMYGHDQLIESLEKAAHNHPRTTFIACHLANLDYDLGRLGQMLDRNPNLYADISARSAEIATIPRFANQFFRKYSNRVVYGTDLGYTAQMFGTTFRILQSTDDHFYTGSFGLHWPLNGLGLPDDVLKKLYRDNMRAIYKKAQSQAA
jgi:predicted TIM-barrel fold metal-dependent hydrolase